jgi:iron complex outermembrane receptor protein
MSTPAGRRRVDTANGPRPRSRTPWLLVPILLLAGGAHADDDGDLPPATSVGEVTATATRADRDQLETAGNVTVLDRQAIEASGARNLPELLRREAGIYVANTTTSRTGYVVEPRGFNNGSGGGSSLLLLVDGRRVNEAESSIPAWELLALDQIERIEIVRGPASALYGDNAMGGVIEVVTRGGEGPPFATLTGRLGRYRTKEGSLAAGGSAGPLALSVFADHFQSDGYREQSGYRIRDFQGRADLALGERASLSVRGGYTTDRRHPPGALTEAQIDDDRRQVAPDSVGSRAGVRNRFVDGVLRATPWDGVILSLQGYYTRRSDDVFAPDVTGAFTRDFETRAIGLNSKAQLDFDLLGRAARTLVGVDLLREDRDGTDLYVLPSAVVFDFRRRGRKETLGAYVQQEVEIGDRLLLSAGVRHDRASYQLRDIDEVFVTKSVTEPTHALWSPHASVLYRVTGSASVYASYSRGFRLPNLSDTAGVFGPSGRIEPQRSHAWEIGVKQRSRRVRANLALYRMDVTDEILLDSELGGFMGSPGVLTVNIDRVRHQGVEASWSVDPFEWLELHGAYTWDDTRIRRDSLTGLDGKRVPITPEHRGNAGFLLRLPWGLEAGMDVQLVGRRFGVNDFAHDYPKLPSYRRWDLHAAWRPKLGEHVELTFAFDVQNLLDREYSEWGGRRTFLDEEAFFPSPERHYLGTVAVAWRP